MNKWKWGNNCLLILFLTLPSLLSAEVLFDWNEGEGERFPGWVWSEDVAYREPGWIMEGGELGAGETYKWGDGPRSFNKADYGDDNTAIIDLSQRAPSTTEGGSLKVYELPDSTDHRSTWWVWYDGKPLSERGITDANTDRMSFYIKIEGMDPINDDGGEKSMWTGSFHIGTYLCWFSGAPTYGSGDGCPYEGPGNQHYYHYMAFNTGGWIHALLDQHPQHLRGSKEIQGNNPSFTTDQKNYFEYLHMFYMEIRYPQEQFTSFNVDELYFYNSKELEEPNQNEESVTSLWVGYWPESDNWEIGFQDMSFDTYNDASVGSYQVRWSVKPITSDNFASANIVMPLFYSGEDYVGVEGSGVFRRANSWQTVAWTRFKLPDDIEKSKNKIYFAVKDVSVKGANAGNKWPWSRPDGHNAPNDYIKVIDYSLNALQVGDHDLNALQVSPPNPPASLSVKVQE